MLHSTTPTLKKQNCPKRNKNSYYNKKMQEREERSEEMATDQNQPKRVTAVPRMRKSSQNEREIDQDDRSYLVGNKAHT